VDISGGVGTGWNDHRLLISVQAAQSSSSNCGRAKDSPVDLSTVAGQPLKPGPHKIRETAFGLCPQNLSLERFKGGAQTRMYQVPNEIPLPWAQMAKEEGILAAFQPGAECGLAAIEGSQRPEK